VSVAQLRNCRCATGERALADAHLAVVRRLLSTRRMQRIAVIVVLAACHGSGSTEPPEPDGSQGPGPDAAPTMFTDPPLNGPPFVVNTSDCGSISVQAVDVDSGGAVQLDTIACRGLVYSDEGIANAHDHTIVYTTLDLYLPASYQAGDPPRPAIVFIHGGGWWSGAPSAITPNQYGYLAKGYAVLSIGYRLSPYTYPGDPPRNPTDPQWVTFPKNIQDVKTALQWIRLKLPAIVDPDRIVAWGFSAGAHLAMLAGSSGGEDALEGRAGSAVSSRVQAVVAQSPALDLNYFAHPTSPDHIGPDFPQTDPVYNNDPATPDHKCPENDDWANSRLAIEGMVGDVVDPPTANSIAASPGTYLDPGDPPMFALTASCDATVTYRGNVLWAQQVGQPILGDKFHFEIAPYAMHGGTLGPQNPTGRSDVRDFIFAAVGP
jgi:acetyl esterase/lipase